VQQSWGRPYIAPTPNPFWCDFHLRDDPDLRNVDAFDFVCKQLQGIARTQGSNHAQIERSVLVERGVAAGLARNDIEASITVMILGEHCNAKDSIINLPQGTQATHSRVNK
jgi:hypothetical protein